MKRRTLIQSMAALAAAGGSTLTAGAVHGQQEDRNDLLPLIKPQRLARGMTVALVAPSSPPKNAERVRYAIEVLESLGFKVRQGKHIWERTQYLAGSDEQRAEDVNQAFSEPEVGAVFCLRGGYGTMRILPYLDYDLIRNNPKIITGFSDTTGIINPIHARTGLVTFHGPVAIQRFTDYTLEEYRKVMVKPTAPVEIAAPPPFEAGEGQVEFDNRITRFVGGKARGRLIGGNLTLLAHLVGTPYEPDYRNSILFLEEVDEAPYRIDRMLTHLWLAGRLQQCAGIALGKFTRSSDDGNSFTLEEIFDQRFKELGLPCIRGLMIGHVRDRASVPLGVEAELDADAGTLTLLETAVV